MEHVVQWNLCKTATLKKDQKLVFGFQDQLSLNAVQKYCSMLQGEYSAILLTFIKLPIVIKIFVLSIFKWPFNTGFTVQPLPFHFLCPARMLLHQVTVSLDF